ncbi:MAG: hypothetical protein KGK01_15620, partial [Bradyrhizobium sp.]|nr:hypothetical protein [Bradyrhizobium sp.]
MALADNVLSKTAASMLRAAVFTQKLPEANLPLIVRELLDDVSALKKSWGLMISVRCAASSARLYEPIENSGGTMIVPVAIPTAGCPPALVEITRLSPIPQSARAFSSEVGPVRVKKTPQNEESRVPFLAHRARHQASHR